jgi:hypothetical protein
MSNMFHEKLLQTDRLPADLVVRGIGNMWRREPVTHQDGDRGTNHDYSTVRKSVYCPDFTLYLRHAQ